MSCWNYSNRRTAVVAFLVMDIGWKIAVVYYEIEVRGEPYLGKHGLAFRAILVFFSTPFLHGLGVSLSRGISCLWIELCIVYFTVQFYGRIA